MLHDCVPAAMDEHVDSLMEEDAGRATRVNKGGAKALRSLKRRRRNQVY